MAFKTKIKIGSGVDLEKKLRWGKRKAREAGVEFEGDTRSGTFDGKISGHYRVSGNTIEITITDKPFFVTQGMIVAKLRELFAGN